MSEEQVRVVYFAPELNDPDGLHWLYSREEFCPFGRATPRPLLTSSADLPWQALSEPIQSLR